MTLRSFPLGVPEQIPGSHMRLTCPSPSEHHVTIPNHDPLRIGTLAATLDSVARHHGLSRDALLERLFSK
ncbi:MAG: hypothetical protein U1D28_08260 [Burkholderiales bacterium]|nr:hypothetical protein [Burkholderiales bacterium]